MKQLSLIALMTVAACFSSVAMAVPLFAPAQPFKPSKLKPGATAQAGQIVSDEGDQPGVDLSEFNHVDPKHMIADKPLRRALTYFKTHQSQFGNRQFIGVIDYTKHSSTRRFFIVNLRTGKVEAHLTAHGKGSDPDYSGWARRFSNRPNSEATSIGYYKTAEVYYGNHGRSMRLVGLSKTNNNAYSRAVVIHPAHYVSESGRHAGRSWGCPAVDPDVHDELINKLRGQAMIYAYGGNVVTR